MTHIMENILYNELVVRECAVDIGVVYSNAKDSKGKINKVASLSVKVHQRAVSCFRMITGEDMRKRKWMGEGYSWILRKNF